MTYPNTGTWTVESCTYVSGDLELHYLDARREGPRSPGRTMLAIHGLGAHGDSWLPTVNRLSAVDRVIAPDLRGHGLSSWTRDGYWLRNYADDLVKLIDKLGLQQLDMVGMSLGARVAMILGARVPSLLTSVIIVDTGPEVSREGARRAKEFAPGPQEATAKSDGFRDRDELMAFLKAKWVGFEPEALGIRADRLYRRNWADLLVHRVDPETSWYLGRAGLKEVDDMWAGLAAIPVATLLLRGKESFLLDEDLSRRILGVLRHPHYEEVEADHFMMHTSIDLFSTLVDSFLRENALVGDAS
ncbi:MAG TPA: alpha/beta hydrolase [Jatrophihabitantaceae bacterium]|jgi:pimeloyl-ACP methyl ester carboxylesterase|nr:alpha/beta hydrolase [Jatrophihabitantaceae bacterium]